MSTPLTRAMDIISMIADDAERKAKAQPPFHQRMPWMFSELEEAIDNGQRICLQMGFASAKNNVPELRKLLAEFDATAAQIAAMSKSINKHFKRDFGR